MEHDIEQGFAFILEGATEYQFYDALLQHFCAKHVGCRLEQRQDPENFELYYVLHGPFGKRMIRFNEVGTITQIHNSLSWVKNVCLATKGKAFPWTIFLCYDTDAYDADITKFYEDDWQEFRTKLAKRRIKKILDLAASADIEDVFLQDLHGIGVFMGLTQELCQADIPSGRKGSARMKQPFCKAA